jgi:hypothetical protein
MSSDEITVLPKSRLVRVEFELALPVAATYDEVEEWVNLALCIGGSSTDNPLDPFGVEAASAPVLTDTGFHLHEKATPQADGKWRITKWREDSPFEGPSAIDVAIGRAAPKPE